MTPFLGISRFEQNSRRATSAQFVHQDNSLVLDWAGFCKRINSIRHFVLERNLPRWVVADSDVINFAAAIIAVLQAGKEVMLPRNPTAQAFAEITDPSTGNLTESGITGFPCLSEIISQRLSLNDQPFPAIDPNLAQFRLFTSGSTGQPQEVPKKLRQIEAELANLFAIWVTECAGRTFFTTVQHHHFYGLLFYVFLPLCAGWPICVDLINYPETLQSLQDRSVSIVGSPAFYKRFVESASSGPQFTNTPVLFSSGGHLPSEIANFLSSQVGAPVHEIYGSTETGGIAWRDGPVDLGWNAFPGIDLRIDGESRIVVRSPYLVDDAWLVTSDRGSLDTRGRLNLEGRIDSVVKIEEKRVSLSEVERRLRESPLVAEARVIALEEGRQFLAAVVILNMAGREWMAGQAKQAVNAHFRDWLRPWFEATVLPRKWRFVDVFPQDSMGKVAHAALVGLFAKPLVELNAGIQIDHVEQIGDRVVIDFQVPMQSQWFQGHFPAFPILPGVVQIDWLMRCTRRYLGIQADLKTIPRLKFMKPVRPDTPMRLDFTLNRESQQLVYQYADLKGGMVYSSGKLNLGNFS